jgi:hypothetical protein
MKVGRMSLWYLSAGLRYTTRFWLEEADGELKALA